MTDDPARGGSTTNILSDRSPARPPVGVALKSAAGRLARLLQHETTALRQRRPVDLDELCDRKNQALLDLSRLGHGLDRETIDPGLQSQLGDLREVLDENRSILELHLRAVRDVADILATAIRESESDGTYSTLGTVKGGI
ncbi:MAG TPA: hypothetical protein VFJ13_12200 [Paracoccaceae bacterium]|nr:hypothetical protein [Paracoccaceae bacterium]